MTSEGQIRKAKGKNYWSKRYDRHHVKVPGYGNSKNQSIEYAEKINFVMKVAEQVKTLDYGCGIGWYAPYFTDYLGYDFISKAVDLAKEKNPDKNFTTDLKEAIDFKPKQVLYATVLQHIPDNKIVDSLILADTVIIYENVSNNQDKNYIWFRTIQYYVDLFADLGYKVISIDQNLIKNEEHALIKFKR